MNNQDYTDKNVFVGIDVHKKTYYCVSICDGMVVKKDRLAAKPSDLLKYLNNKFSGAKLHTAYEAGFSGFHLHRYLASNGINNSVIHPGSIEVAARDRVKTDKRDALKIATQLSTGVLRCIFIPDEHREARRSVTRLRLRLQRSRVRIGNQFKSLLYTQGLILDSDDTPLHQTWIKRKQAEIQEGGYHSDCVYTANYYVEQWLELTQQLKSLDAHLKHQSKEEPRLNEIYRSAPGIGPLHARELANELSDMKQFSNEKQLFSFTGLTPSEYSSGERQRQGAISRQGRACLRKLLIEAAWVAIRFDASLHEIFTRIAKNRGKKRAIVAVARRLIGRIRSCVLNNRLYEIQPKLEKDAQLYNEVEPVCMTS